MGDHIQIETGVDKLLSLVNERHEVTLSHAAGHLKVPRHVADQWSETLEEAGLVVTKQAIGEKFLMSLEFSSCKRTKTKSFMQQVKSFYVGKDPAERYALVAKEKEVDGKLHLLDERLKRLSRFEELKAQTDAAMRKMKEEEFRFLSLRQMAEREQRALEHEKAAVTELQARLMEREAEMNERMDTFAIRIKTLDARERHLSERQKEIERIISKIAKLKLEP